METTEKLLTAPTPLSRPILCLLNGMAGSDTAEARRDEIARAFAALNQPVEIVLCYEFDGMGPQAKEAAARGDRLVIAGGGDGTISTVANALAGTDTALAILPLGTLNHFAKDLGIPLEVEAAAANAFAGHVCSVDVGEVNERVFINNSSIGLYPAIVRERETLQEEGHSKWTAFAQALVAASKRSRSMRVRLRSKECTLSTRTEFVFIGNNAYDLGPPHIGGRNRLDEAVLWVCHLPHSGRFRALLAALWAIFAAPQSNTPLVFTTKEVLIETRKRHVDVALDGEVIAMQAPLRYRIRPDALRVITPAAAS
jgi:diacylglycerol kinase family enzyme